MYARTWVRRIKEAGAREDVGARGKQLGLGREWMKDDEQER